jgi:PTS system glucose-specific IIA component
MFRFFKKRPLEVFAISNGEVIELAEVKDEVFSKKLVGDGVAIIPTNGQIVAPIKGIVTRIFPTNHAFYITTKNGLEIMVHIGLDTVQLKGKGFKRLIKEGKLVNVGDVIIEVDLDYLKSKDKDIVTALIVNSKKSITIQNKKVGFIKSGDTIFEILL